MVVGEADPRDLLQVVTGGVLPVEDWEAVYRDHVVPVYRFAYARVGNRPDAEDVTAAVFERALPRLRSGASEAQLRGYLFATARSVLAEHWEQRFSVNLLEGDIAEPPADDTPGLTTTSRSGRDSSGIRRSTSSS